MGDILNQLTEMISSIHECPYGTKHIMPRFVELTKKHNTYHGGLDTEYFWGNNYDTNLCAEEAGPSLTAQLLFGAQKDFREQVGIWTLVLEQELNHGQSRYEGWGKCHGLFPPIWLELKADYDYTTWPYHHASRALPNGCLPLDLFKYPTGTYELAGLLAMLIAHVTAYWHPVKITTNFTAKYPQGEM